MDNLDKQRGSSPLDLRAIIAKENLRIEHHPPKASDEILPSDYEINLEGDPNWAQNKLKLSLCLIMTASAIAWFADSLAGAEFKLMEFLTELYGINQAVVQFGVITLSLALAIWGSFKSANLAKNFAPISYLSENRDCVKSEAVVLFISPEYSPKCELRECEHSGDIELVRKSDGARTVLSKDIKVDITLMDDSTLEHKWSSLLKSIESHLSGEYARHMPLKAIYLLGTAGKVEGSYKDIELAIKLVKNYIGDLPISIYKNEKGANANSIENCYQHVQYALNKLNVEMKIKDSRISLDMTPGKKQQSAAVTLASLNNKTHLQYVDGWGKNAKHYYYEIELKSPNDKGE